MADSHIKKDSFPPGFKAHLRLPMARDMPVSLASSLDLMLAHLAGCTFVSLCKWDWPISIHFSASGFSENGSGPISRAGSAKPYLLARLASTLEGSRTDIADSGPSKRNQGDTPEEPMNQLKKSAASLAQSICTQAAMQGFQSLSKTLVRSVHFHADKTPTKMRAISGQFERNESLRKRIVQLVKTKYQATRKGDWAAVLDYVKASRRNFRKPWTAAEVDQLEEIINREYLGRLARRTIDWDAIARTFGRSAAACFLVHHRYRSRHVYSFDPRLVSNAPVLTAPEIISELPHIAQDLPAAVAASTAAGKVDWDAVARTLDAPLLFVLKVAVHVALNAHPPRPLPDTARCIGTDSSERERLVRFVHDQFGTDKLRATVDWHCVGLYMDASPISCLAAYKQCVAKDTRTVVRAPRRGCWSASEIELLEHAMHISRTREASGEPRLRWIDVARIVATKSASACQCFWDRRTSAAERTQAWTPDEIERMDKFVRDYMETRTERSRVILPHLMRMFPDKSKHQVKDELHKAKHRIGRQIYAKWTPERIDLLVQCVFEMGTEVDWVEVSKRLGRAGPYACEMKYLSLAKTARSRSFAWAADEVERLQSGVDAFSVGAKIDFRAVSEFVATRSPQQCALKWMVMRKADKRRAEQDGQGAAAKE